MRDADSLRFEDVVTFLTVHQTRSISSAARQLQVTPSQVSKAVLRLEVFVGEQLLARGPRGIAVSMAGLRVIPMLEEIARGVRDLRSQHPEAAPMTRIAAPSSLVASIAAVLARNLRSVRLSCLELDPMRMRALALEDVYDVALLSDERPLGDLFVHEPIGKVESRLFARPSVAKQLGPPPVVASVLRDVPFVMPLSLEDSRVSRGRDLCPLPFEQRMPGHAASTFGAALELAASSDSLVFGPLLAARPFIERSELVVVDVEGWSVHFPLYLACHTTRVQAKTARTFRTVLARWLEQAQSDEALR